MGSAISTQLANLPDRLDQAQVQSIGGNQYNEKRFKLFADSDGKIAKTMVVYMMSYKYDVFLTHNWANDLQGRNNHERVSQINQGLKECGLITWFDQEKMQGKIVDMMCNGISDSLCVAVFITQLYMEKVVGENENDNCKLEFQFATMEKSSAGMVPVVMENHMKNPRDWKGQIKMFLGGSLYVDMSKDSNLGEKCSELAQSIVQSIKKVANMSMEEKPYNNTNTGASLASSRVQLSEDNMAIVEMAVHKNESSSSSDESKLVNEISSLNTAKATVDWFNGAIKGSNKEILMNSKIVANAILTNIIKHGNNKAALDVYGEDVNFFYNLKNFLKSQFQTNPTATLEKGYEAVGKMCRFGFFASTSNDSNVRKLCANGFCELLSETQLNHPAHSVLAGINFLKCVEYLSDEQETNKTKFLESRGCDAIASVLKDLGKKDGGDLCLQGFHAIRALTTKHEGVRAGLVGAGIPKIAVNLLNFYEIERNEVVEIGFRAVSNAINGKDRAFIAPYIEAGICDIVVRTMTKQALTSSVMAMASLGLVRNLANGDAKFKELLGNNGGAQATLEILKIYLKDNQVTATEACICTTNLCANCPKNKKDMGENGICALVIECMIKFGVDYKPAALEGLYAMKSLLLHSDNVPRAKNANISAVVKKMKDKYGGNDGEIRGLCEDIEKKI